MKCGEDIIDEIIESGLFAARCTHSEEHGCIVVWSSAAAEQIEAMVFPEKELKAVLMEIVLLRKELNACKEQLAAFMDK